jgi:hypothetical protein
VIGFWLFISPWVFAGAAAGAAAWSFWIVGILIAILALAALSAFHVWEEWVNVVLGLWMIVSPWVLGFSAAAGLTWNAVIMGVLVVAFAGWAVGEHSRAGAT